MNKLVLSKTKFSNWHGITSNYFYKMIIEDAQFKSKLTTDHNPEH